MFARFSSPCDDPRSQLSPCGSRPQRLFMGRGGRGGRGGFGGPRGGQRGGFPYRPCDPQRPMGPCQQFAPRQQFMEQPFGRHPRGPHHASFCRTPPQQCALRGRNQGWHHYGMRPDMRIRPDMSAMRSHVWFTDADEEAGTYDPRFDFAPSCGGSAPPPSAENQDQRMEEETAEPQQDLSEETADNQPSPDTALWVAVGDQVWTGEVEVGPFNANEVEVHSDGLSGVEVNASHYHGDTLVASMMRRLPPPPCNAPFIASHVLNTPHSVLITARPDTTVTTDSQGNDADQTKEQQQVIDKEQ